MQKAPNTVRPILRPHVKLKAVENGSDRAAPDFHTKSHPLLSKMPRTKQRLIHKDFVLMSARSLTDVNCQSVFIVRATFSSDTHTHTL